MQRHFAWLSHSLRCLAAHPCGRTHWGHTEVAFLVDMSERMLELMEGIMVCWGQELVLQRQSTGARSKSFSASIRLNEATGRNSLNSVSMVVGLCEDKSSRWRL